MFDLVINHGHIEDPTNGISSKLNIGVKNGKIAEISQRELNGNCVIDAENLIVSPGFIDIHMHEDPYDEESDSFKFLIAESMLKMGVTTTLGGNCGIGPKDPVVYLDAIDRKKYPVNMGLFVPHESLRNSFGNFDKYLPVDEKIIKGMAEKLKVFLEKGCFGVSFGVEYIPGINEREMLKLAEVCSGYGKSVGIHVREDGEKIISSVMEAINLGEETGAPIQISHIGSMGAFGHMPEVLSLIDEYRAHGIDVVCDCYPYDACCTHIGATTFDDGFLEGYNIGYDSLEIGGKVCTEEIFKTTRRNSPETLTVAHIMKESEVDMAICHPACITASDGIYVNSQGHPRGSGTFPRLINHYVKEKKLLTLTEAIEKITTLPAKRFDLKGKGNLAIGSDADITIFNFEKIKDCADYENPLKAPEGIEYVFINGQLALKKDKIINAQLGKSIRK